MKVDKLTIERIFERAERLEAPLFQRPYVWREDENWLPLWESIQLVAERQLSGMAVRPHFLGTIVLDQLKTSAGRLHARQIIDGQQRLTTLQLAIAAARDLSNHASQERYGQAFMALTDNHVPLSDEPDDVFKVWPTNADRENFRDVMKAGSLAAVHKLPHSDPNDEWLIPDAYIYFYGQFADWLGSSDTPEFVKRLNALYAALKDHLHLVVIDLEDTDDPQEIFETLNALGTPLLPADLVKNYLFHLAQGQKHDTKKLYNQYWETFDGQKGYWRQEVRQGRLKRARIDLFLFHYLTLMVADEVPGTQLFTTYRAFVEGNNGKCAATHMGLLREYADVYRSFEEFPADSSEALFFYRLAQLDTTTVYPLVLEVLKRYGNPECRAEREQILLDVESFLVRRVVCQLTSKGYNRFFVDMIKDLRAKNDFSPSAIRTFLIAQTAETSRWPNDEDFQNAWLTISFYHRLKRAVARMILEGVESAMYIEKSEKIQIPHDLTIEHLMPVQWSEHWPFMVPEQDEAARKKATDLRNELIHKVGNLTLLTKKLNPAVSNSAWSVKQPEIVKHSVLALNRAFHKQDEWNEVLIFKRSQELFSYAKTVWPRPAP
jgi:hypothetical protein